jgi:hypothetical protein
MAYLIGRLVLKISSYAGITEFRQYDFRQLDIRQCRNSYNVLARLRWKLANRRKCKEYAGESMMDLCQWASVRDFADKSPPYLYRSSQNDVSVLR